MTVREMVTAQYAERYSRSRANAQQGEHECACKRFRHLGEAYAGIEGMCMSCYGEHAREIVEVSDEVTQQIKDAALKCAKENYGIRSGPDDLGDIIKNYIRTVDVDRRLASSWTLQQIWYAEVDRIGWYIHSQDPSWTMWGQAYDTSILDNYQQGVDVKA